MYIKGENDQGNLRKFLTVQEEISTAAQFFRKLANMQKDDPANVYCKTIDVDGVKYAFLITKHPHDRSDTRTSLTRKQLHTRCSQLLSDPFVYAHVTEFPMEFADDGVNITTSCSTANGSTAIVDERTNSVFVFEAGFQYIRLVTVWNTHDGVFLAVPGTRLLKIRIDGSVEKSEQNIPEIQISARNR